MDKGIFKKQQIKINVMSEFKDIPNYDGYYKIDKKGNVLSLKNKIHKILKPRENSNGYLYINLSKNGKYKSIMIHKLVAITYLNHVPNFKQNIVVDHINNIKTDNNLSNLQLITQRENTAKRVLKNKTSKYVGVRWEYNKWGANIVIDKVNYKLGRFDNELDARKAYLKKLKQL